MDESQNSQEKNEVDLNQIALMVTELRQKAFMQIIYGLLWWLGSSAAMYFALASKGDNVIYWYGGALGSLFHWYRAFKMIRATQQVGAKPLVQREAVVIGITAFIVFFTSYTIIPEYFRMQTPTIGTCWTTASSEDFMVTACWSSNAEFKTTSYEYSADYCDTNWYLKPSLDESRYGCLEEMS